MNVRYLLLDTDGAADLNWDNIAVNQNIPVDIDSITYASTEVPGEYELIIYLRSKVPKPTWKLRTR